MSVGVASTDLGKNLKKTKIYKSLAISAAASIILFFIYFSLFHSTTLGVSSTISMFGGTYYNSNTFSVGVSMLLSFVSIPLAMANVISILLWVIKRDFAPIFARIMLIINVGFVLLTRPQ
ncbi:MAG: hypothetical protein FWB91_14335 [Defluviitaleaceae bacterium]|nr:hypothetical protein [Defluviitaleaceae bacterium]